MTQNLITGKIFGEKNMVSIIMSLYLFGPQKKSDLYRAISTNPRMPQKLQILENYGIIKSTMDIPSGRTIIELTDLGVKYGSSLESLERQTGGSIEQYKWNQLKNTIDRYGGLV